MPASATRRPATGSFRSSTSSELVAHLREGQRVFVEGDGAVGDVVVVDLEHVRDVAARSPAGARTRSSARAAAPGAGAAGSCRRGLYSSSSMSCLPFAPRAPSLSVYGAPRLQSTGSAPAATSSSLARLNGREPKNPLLADSGLGCAEAMIGVSPSSGRSVPASRPHRIATSGPPRATSARIACSVTASQPLPRCEPETPGLHGEHPVEQHDALLAPTG